MKITKTDLTGTELGKKLLAKYSYKFFKQNKEYKLKNKTK